MRAKKQPTCKNSGKKKQEGCKIAVKSPFEKKIGASGFAQWTIRLHPPIQFFQQAVRHT